MADGGPAPVVLVCPQEFKGSLTAIEAAHAIAEGVRDALGPDVAIRELPLGDGGPGTVDACIEAMDAERVRIEVVGHQGEPTEAAYALLDAERGATAIIESAAACGLVAVEPGDRRPVTASTFGVGQLIADAIERGAARVIVGVGGTGTNDGGAGAALALGLRQLDSLGVAIEPGALGLTRLASLERDDTLRSLRGAELCIAVDVTNALLGHEGATAIYGAQKGVRDWQVPALDSALAHWAAVIEQDLGCPLADLPGAGAGGGLPVGLLASAHAADGTATIESGAALVAGLVQLDAAIAAADLIVTGEGSIDAQTAYGKTVGYVAERAAQAGRDCLAIGGRVDGRLAGILDVEASAPDDVSVEEAMALGAEPVRAAADRVVRRWLEARAR